MVAVSDFGARKGVCRMAKQDTESAKVTDIDNLTVSVGVLANIFGLTERSIRLKAEEGIIVRASKGRYRLVESLKNYVLALRLQADGLTTDDPDGEINIEEEKALHERVKRHISELKLQTMKGELHKAADVESVRMDMLVAFKTSLQRRRRFWKTATRHLSKNA